MLSRVIRASLWVGGAVAAACSDAPTAVKPDVVDDQHPDDHDQLHPAHADHRTGRRRGVSLEHVLRGRKRGR